MAGEQSAPTTFLYTDLVNSTELLSRLGDERAQRVFQAHHKLLREATEANGGQEVKWQGDGVMDAFASTAAAVRCAISMQQSASRPIDGERLEVRVGLNVGEALGWEEADYFGSPVVVAARLCHEANGGQILCSSVVVALLSGRQAFQFRGVGELELKGIPEPVAASEVLYEPEQPGARLRHTPFVGRTAEAAKLNEALQETRAGHGGLVMLVGEPGIGKTRLAEEFTEMARNEGATILWGRCYEGEWTPLYSPFAEAIQQYARSADPEELREDLGIGVGSIARVVPALHEQVSEIPEPTPLEPGEEGFRLFDAVSQFLIASSRRAPVVLMLDDLHWADKGTIAMLRHVARFAPGNRLLLVGAYRDVELDRQHPLADALGDLQRVANYERVLLKGLDIRQVGELLATIGEQDLPDELVGAIAAETDGNPFFLRAVLLDLVEKGAIYWRDGHWGTDVRSVKDLRLPEGVRQVIGRRLSRLSEDANRLLTAASAYNGGFHFDIAASVADLDETRALDAIDAALEAQLVQPGSQADSYDFVHASIRHTLYAELSPSRQVRLHRRAAEAMEERYSGRTGELAAELAYQYHRSAALPGAERGIDYALAAADRAEAAYAHDEAATFLRMALELMPEDDPRRPRLLGRLGVALAWTLAYEEALKAASEAGDLIAVSEGPDAAADYLADGAATLRLAGFERGAAVLASQGLKYVADRESATWVRLRSHDLWRGEAEDPQGVGITLDTQEWRQLWSVIEKLPVDQRKGLPDARPHSRQDALSRSENVPGMLTDWAGEYRRARPLWEHGAKEAELEGRILWCAYCWSQVATCHTALGEFNEARAALEHGTAFAARLTSLSGLGLNVVVSQFLLSQTLDEGLESFLDVVEPGLEQPPAEYNYAIALLRAGGLLIYARLGRSEEALGLLATLLTPLERTTAYSGYTFTVCAVAEALWLLDKTDHIDLVERNLLAKVIAADFRTMLQDGRLSEARLCALQGRYDEAIDWFAQARAVLDEQGALPLRAIVDYDEALMYYRRGEKGDEALGAPLLGAALAQFRELGMPGWIRRAEELQKA